MAWCGSVCWLHTSFFLWFQVVHPNVKLGQHKFEVLKPYFVKPCKERNVCCYKYHLELDMLRQGLNNRRDVKKGAHTTNKCGCGCSVCNKVFDQDSMTCQAHVEAYKGVTMLWEECLCPKLAFEEWHKLDCLMGSCHNCGVEKNLPIYPNEFSLLNEWKVLWRPKKRIKECFK